MTNKRMEQGKHANQKLKLEKLKAEIGTAKSKGKFKPVDCRLRASKPKAES